jgi:hypothetical protein
VFKSLTSVQLVPFQDSVLPEITGLSPGEYPPKIKPAVLDPAVPLTIFSLAVFKSLTSVQLLPFHTSLFA